MLIDLSLLFQDDGDEYNFLDLALVEQAYHFIPALFEVGLSTCHHPYTKQVVEAARDGSGKWDADLGDDEVAELENIRKYLPKATVAQGLAQSMEDVLHPPSDESTSNDLTNSLQI